MIYLGDVYTPIPKVIAVNVPEVPWTLVMTELVDASRLGICEILRKRLPGVLAFCDIPGIVG